MWKTRRMGTLLAAKTHRPWASIMKTVTVDVDRYPLLQVNVLAASKSWYIILSGPQFPDGFLRLVETDKTGHFSFDLKKMTALSGPQKMDVKIGVSQPGGTALEGVKVSFNKLAFLSRPSAAGQARSAPYAAPAQPGANDYYLFPSSRRDLDAWVESAKDGPQEVRFSVSKGLGIIRGELTPQNWGALRRPVTVDLDKYPLLKVHVLSSTRRWFLLVTHPGLPGGYLRLIETDKPGAYEFNLPKLTGLSKSQTFEFQMGVSDPSGVSVKGETMVFDRVYFTR